MLLAAGAARRFGSDKRRHRLQSGGTLLENSVRRYAAAFAELLVVLRPGDEDLAAAIEPVAAAAGAGLDTVYCADAHLGMGHSLACGARAAPGHWQYLFVALADMPWVEVSTLRQLRSAMERAGAEAIVQPTCNGEPGHPVGFGAEWRAALQQIRGDGGARPLLARAGARLQRLDVTDPGILRDLDRPPA